MGLSPALVDYAENIWRRFPEAFIALGLPQLDDLFDLHEGAWCYRVVDTRSEKIIEIVLPRRRNPEDGEDLSDVEQPGNWSNQAQGPHAVSDAVRGSSRAAFGNELAARVGKLGLDVSNLQKSIKECVSREIKAKIREAQPLNPRAKREHQAPNPALLEAQGRLTQSRAGQLKTNLGGYGQGPGYDEGHGRNGNTSPTESVVSWTSSLAARRGMNMARVDISRLPPQHGAEAGPQSVKRVPLLDRTFASGTEDRGVRSGHAYHGQAGPNPEAELQRHMGRDHVGHDPPDADISPGAELQRLARRRKAAGVDRADVGAGA